MTDRILYTLTAIALACVFILDPSFSENFANALGGPLAATPLDSWEKWLAAIFVVLAAIAIVRELRRPR